MKTFPRALAIGLSVISLSFATAFALPAISNDRSSRNFLTTPGFPQGPAPTCIDAWSTTSTTNAPVGRYFHTAVWTGSEMIVWGGQGNGSSVLNTGGRYNPSTDSWTATSTVNAPSARQGHTAIWTGSELIIWGGFDGAYVNTGARYNPATNSWTALSSANAPSARGGHTAVWTGTEMIVWGGFFYNGNTQYLNTGGRYNPTTNTWIATGTVNAPTSAGHTAVWTGSEMIVWGGTPDGMVGSNIGGRYNPIADSWTPTTTTNAPTARSSQSAVWTGSEMIIWGGSGMNTGAKYNPGTNSWTTTTITSAPAARSGHSAVWTGSEMIIWGGSDPGFASLNTGGRYNPGANSWAPTATFNAPMARGGNTTMWTGSEMIVWGGVIPGEYLNSGARYCGLATGPSPTPTPTPPVPTPTPPEPPTPTPTTFGFVPGHYYSSNPSTRVIKEYNGAGIGIASFTLPAALGDEVRGLAFGPDGLLYAAVSRGSSCAVLALRSDGSVAISYTWPFNVTGGSTTTGKIAMDNQYLYLSGLKGLTRFLLGDPSSGTSIASGNPTCDVKPLPNGHLFVAYDGNIDEITTSGALVRHVTPYPFSALAGVRGIEYNPATNILFVTHLGLTGFSDRVMRFNATTGALLSDNTLGNPNDLFLDASGNLLVASSSENPTFFSQDLVQGDHLHGGQQMFVTQYAPSHALNISTRMRVESGDNALIGGFIITGTATKSVAIRGIGPSLAQFGIPDTLADPTLELHDSSGALLQQNDNWQDDPAQASQLTALGLAPQNQNESGLVVSLSPSSYTAVLKGKNGGTGVGLVEIYDTTPGADSQLANISTRGFVLTDNNVMIGGFILGGANNTHVVVRGIGPSLAQLGLSPVLADPTLELRDSNGALLVSNDNWQDDAVSASQLTAFGLAPTNTVESGIVVSALPGAFTAILAGKNGGTGIGLVEIYNVH